MKKKYITHMTFYVFSFLLLCFFILFLENKNSAKEQIQNFSDNGYEEAPFFTSEVLPPLNTSPPPSKIWAFTSKESDFSLHKLGSETGPTLLVVGGIQGDEPGGFSAAALLTTHYRITHGAVWVVPDLNFTSILQRNRGIFGDMNRKFAALPQEDPEYELVARIKSILLDSSVDLILNLHDGSGFYRPKFETPLRNPRRWGQCVIIDQEELPEAKFKSLYQMAQNAANDVNKQLLDKGHAYHIKNTRTKEGDKEMEKTLSYFAICNQKPAFGVEASKEFNTEQRAYYHLHLIESFMRQMGIQFERKFELAPTDVRKALNSNLMLAAYGNKIIFALDDSRAQLSMIPFKKGTTPEAQATRPLLALVGDKEDWRVAYGNRTLTRLKPIYMDFDDSLSAITMELDGEKNVVPFGEKIVVNESFLVDAPDGYRVNAIGARKERNGTEAGITLIKKDFLPRFSVDKSETTYRVEVYKNDAFSGMILVQFGSKEKEPSESLTAIKGLESEHGF